jgi:hypothetical protein
MSKQEPAKEEKPATSVTSMEFVVAKVGGKFLRFATREAVPSEGIEEGPYNLDVVNDMTVETVGELYSKIAGVSPKKFKNKKVAVESLSYQVAKMPIFDPNAVKSPLAEAVKAGARANKPAADGDKKYARKTPDTFELLQPAELDKVMRGLTPQARELVLIMTDLAKEKGAVSFAGNDLNEYLKKPEVAARLRTKQDPLRILQYYKGALISKGLVRVS